jgi:hypothetical protein
MPPDLGMGSARLNDAYSSLASGGSILVPLPDARAPSSVAAHASQQPQSSQQLLQQQQQAQQAQSSTITELLKRQRQLQRGAGKFPPGYGANP